MRPADPVRLAAGPVGRLPIGIALPPKITGFLLIDTLFTGQPDLWWLAVKQLTLPALTLGFSSAAPIARVTRSAMAEALQSDYVRTARAKGLGEVTVNMRHAFRNAALPLITLIGLSIPGLFGGAIIVERVFGWPGIGSLLIDGASNRDYTQTMGVTIFLATIVVFANLLADLAYGIADPRVVAATRHARLFRSPVVALLVARRQGFAPDNHGHVEVKLLHALLVLRGVHGPDPRVHAEPLQILRERQRDAFEGSVVQQHLELHGLAARVGELLALDGPPCLIQERETFPQARPHVDGGVRVRTAGGGRWVRRRRCSRRSKANRVSR